MAINWANRAKWTLCLCAFVPLCLLASASAAEQAPPAFAKKPAVTKAGDKVKIAFAVSGPTDVAVYIEDAKGEVVRHLVAGVLGGTNPPPAPLKPGLAQDVEWDGKADYGKPAEGGPFKVRVGLGLKPRYDRVMSRGRTSFAGALALGAGPDGTLYVRQCYMGAMFTHTQLMARNRDGSYRRMLVPFPATVDNAAARGFNVMDLDGAHVPALESERGFMMVFNGGFFQPCSLAVSRDGKTVYAPVASGIIAFNAQGGCDEPLVAGLQDGKAPAANRPTITATASLSTSSDGKYLFLSGISGGHGKPVAGAVYRLSLPGRSGLEVFFGDPGRPGGDREHLGAGPGGVASDGRGSLLVADTANNRVVIVGEADGKYRGEFKADNPECIGAAPAKGAVYVFSRKGGSVVTKFSLPAAPAAGGPVTWDGAKPDHSIPLRFSRSDGTRSMAVDASADPVVVWVSAGLYGEMCRIEDRGGKFEAERLPASIGAGPATDEGYLGVVVDRRTSEVYARNGNFGGVWERFDDRTGKSELLTSFPKGTGSIGLQVVPAPNGNLYGLQWPYFFYQWDRSGKPLPFPEPRLPTDLEMRLNFPSRYRNMKNDVGNWDKKAAAYLPVAMGALPHTLGVRWSDGHLFVIEPYLFSADRTTPRENAGGRIMKLMHEYLPSGRRVTTPDGPIIWKLSDAAVGPKFDAAGNIYVADVVRPKGWTFPPELKPYLADKGGNAAPGSVLAGPASVVAANYGSIVKFGPKGGMIHYENSGWGAATGHDPFDGQPKLAPGLKETEADLFYRRLMPVKITGAEWIHPGVGHIGVWGCNCENMTFDVDEFGRTFFPDFCMYRIRVIDTAGNAIVNFGGYGNADNCGPDSPVVDPKTGLVRPRRADDPKDLVSPFAKPDIALAWPVGVGVTDRHAYIGDAINRRLLRVKLTYAAEESCDIK